MGWGLQRHKGWHAAIPVPMYMYVTTYTHTHVYIYIYIYMCVYTYTHNSYICTRAYVLIGLWVERKRYVCRGRHLGLGPRLFLDSKQSDLPDSCMKRAKARLRVGEFLNMASNMATMETTTEIFIIDYMAFSV